MVKQNKKIRLTAGQVDAIYDYQKKCSWFVEENNRKWRCEEELIYGFRGSQIFCKQHYYQVKKLVTMHGGSTKNFKLGRPKSKNNIPVCSKQSCYTIGYRVKNGDWLCQRHYIRE